MELKDFLPFKISKKSTPVSRDTVRKANRLLKQVGSTNVPDLESSWIAGFNTNPFVERVDYKVVDEMMRDDHIYGVLELKKSLLVSTGYTFVIPDDTEDDRLQEHLAFVEENFGAKYLGLFATDLKKILSAWEYGFSCTEKLYEQIEGKAWLRKLMTLPPHSVDYYTDDMGRISKVVQDQANAMEVELPAWKFLNYSYNDNFNNPYGRTVLERIYKIWKAKNFCFKFWNIFLARHASPLIYGKAPELADTGEYQALKDILDSVQQAASLVIPSNAEIDSIETSSTGEVYDKAMERFNQMIARTVLIPDLLGFGSTTKGGSFSLGQKQYDMFIAIIDQEREVIEDIINEQVIKQLIDINFGVQEIYPQFKFLPFKDDKLTEWLDAFIKGIQQGMPITDEDWNLYREKIGFNTLSEEDLEKIKEEAKEAALEIQNPKEGKEKSDGKDDKKGIDPEKEEPEIKASKEVFAKSTSRMPSKYESRIDFVAEDRVLREEEDKTISKLATILEMTKNELKASIRRKAIMEENKYGEVKKLQLKFMGDVKRQLNEDLNDVYVKSRETAIKEINELKKESRFAASITDPFLTPKQAIKVAKDKLDADTFQAVGKLKDDLLDKSKQVVLSGMDKGYSHAEIANELDIVFNSVTVGAGGAELAVEPYLLETIVRTTYTDFYNLGRRQVAQESDFIEMFQYSAIIDARTTDRCQRLDGKLIKKDDPILNSFTPPLHYNCRSRLRYVTVIDVEEDLLKPSKLPSVDSIAGLSGGEGFV